MFFIIYPIGKSGRVLLQIETVARLSHGSCIQQVWGACLLDLG